MNQSGAALVSEELLRKIDQNRAELSREEFVDHCVDAFLAPEADAAAGERYVTREEFRAFQRNIQMLQASFIEFFVTYGLELYK